MSWKVQWSDWKVTHQESISTPEQVNTLLDVVQSTTEIPTMVEFFNDEGKSLAIGIGRSLTVLTYQQSNDPPYFISLGQSDASGAEWFCYGQEESEYMGRNLVSWSAGLQALKEFVKNGEKPTSVIWERL